jgi:quinolinate synthase
MELSLGEEIALWKKKREAVILAHYYCPAETQALADFVGDSFYLAKVAKGTDAKVIVFCGVGFMGESAKILNPEKTVVMPDRGADCAMAHMVKEGEIERMREKYPDLAVVCYINSTARLKAQSDVCVTSSNALRIVRDLPQKNIFFIPDQNLGRFVAESVPEKNVILNDGFCPIHAEISALEVARLKAEHPCALVLTHPECGEEVTKISDFLGSTKDIIEYAKNSSAEEFIICTEDGVEFALETAGEGKRFYFPEPRPRCMDMKLSTPEGVLRALETLDNPITVTEEERLGALRPLEKMLEMCQ